MVGEFECGGCELFYAREWILATKVRGGGIVGVDLGHGFV